MDPLLIAALAGGGRPVHLVTVTLPDYTIRWTDGGYAKWDGETWKARDATYGALDGIGAIIDGIEEDAEPVALSILAPDLTSLQDLAAADAQGGRTTIHLTALDPATGLVIGEPYRLFIGELDQPRLTTGRQRVLEYDILPLDARGLESNEEQRQTDAFRQAIWPGERGDEYATDGTKQTYWREDDPKNSIGALLGRGVMKSRPEENKAIEFTYEPEAPLAFPIGRCAVKGALRYLVGYGPTNRYRTLFATVGASGPVQELISVTIDDEVTAFDGDDRATDGAHAGEMWFSFLPGDQPSDALTSPTGPNAHSEAAPGWTTDHKLSGRAAYAWTGKENSKKNEFSGGQPSVVVTMNGLSGWDPRTEETYDNRATWVGMTDGATAALNWTMGRWEGDNGDGAYGIPYACWLVGGIGVPLDGIDVDAFSAAATGADGHLWTCGGVPYSDMDKVDVLEDLLAAAGARRSRKCGMVSCVSYAAPGESVLTVTEADTVGQVETVLFPSRLDRRNVAIGRFLSEEQRWEITAIAPVGNPDWQTADGGRRTTSFEFRYVTNADQAAQLTYLWAARQRAGTGEFQGKLYMLQLEPGDCFDWAAPEFLLDGVKARLERREYDPSRLTLRLRYRIETDADYEAALDQEGETPPPTDPETPPGPYVEPPTDFLISEDGGNVLINYRNPISDLFDHVDLYRAASTDFGSATVISFYAGSPGEYVPGQEDVPGSGTWYYWPVAVDFEGNHSDEDQPGLPLSVTIP